MGKYDIKTAYYHAHLSPAIAAESLTVFDNHLLVALHIWLLVEPPSITVWLALQINMQPHQ